MEDDVLKRKPEYPSIEELEKYPNVMGSYHANLDSWSREVLEEILITLRDIKKKRDDNPFGF